MLSSTATYRLTPLRTRRAYRLERPRPRPGLLGHVRHWWRRWGH